MKAWRSYCRALLLVAVATVGPSTAAPSASAVMPDDSLALSPSLRPEVRLRKLHLVRPDLIQYPIAFEVYC